MKSNNTYFNLLASYAYLGNNPTFTEAFFGLHRSGIANVMIDSGAFTAHNAKERRDWLNLDTYCDFLGQYGDMSEKYIMLDVIGNQEKTKENYAEMVRRGLKPMFVLTMYDKEWSFLRDTMKINPDCSVSGGTQTKGPWLIKRFQDVMKYTDNAARIHGLGYVTFPNLFRAPIVSGDSSSWLAQPQRFGAINAWTKDGIKAQLYKEVWAGKPVAPYLRPMLNRIEVTPAQFMQKQYHRGACSIGALMSMICYLDYQKYAQAHNRRLFLAIGSKLNMDMLVWVKENQKDLTYQKFLNEFKNGK